MIVIASSAAMSQPLGRQRRRRCGCHLLAAAGEENGRRLGGVATPGAREHGSMLGLSISMACHFLASPNIFGIPEVSSRAAAAAAPEEKSLIFSTISLPSLFSLSLVLSPLSFSSCDCVPHFTFFAADICNAACCAFNLCA